MLTEFGGIAYVWEQHSQGKTWSYSSAMGQQELANKYRKLLAVVNATVMFSGFCYTQFADTFQEADGPLSADRTPKFPIEQICAATKAMRYDRRSMVMETEAIRAENYGFRGPK